MRTIIDELPKRPSNRKGGDTVKQIPISYKRPATKIEIIARKLTVEINKQRS